jgi:mannose-6-phosphate isomerase-like protein (cupin superfamily)
MTLTPGASEGGPGNRHRGADQWLYVIEGRGRAIVNGRSFALEPGTMLLIERADLHEIRNTAGGCSRPSISTCRPRTVRTARNFPRGKS